MAAPAVQASGPQEVAKKSPWSHPNAALTPWPTLEGAAGLQQGENRLELTPIGDH